VLLDLVTEAVTTRRARLATPGDGLWAQQAFWQLVDAWPARMLWLRHSWASVIALVLAAIRFAILLAGVGLGSGYVAVLTVLTAAQVAVLLAPAVRRRCPQSQPDQLADVNGTALDAVCPFCTRSHAATGRPTPWRLYLLCLCCI
jgi:hypothetical protein